MTSNFVRRLTAACATIALVATSSTVCHAGLLNLVPAGSQIADITTAFTSASYNAATDGLSITGLPVAIDYDQTAPIDAMIFSGGPGNPASYAINVFVDGAGVLVGPSTPTDLNIIGRIPNGPHPSPAYGTLLTGRAIAFGYSDVSPTRLFEFVFEVTGGSQAAQFGPVVGVVYDTINGFAGTFTASFSTDIGGVSDNFAIPEPSAVVLLTLGAGGLLLGRATRRRPLAR